CAAGGDPALGVDGQPVWTSSLVYQAGANPYVSSPVLAFDHYGTPSVSWSLVQTSGGDNTVFHSQLSGLGLWMHHELASGVGVGLSTSLAFDRAERPTVAWLNDTGAIKARFNFGASEQIADNANWDSPILTVSYDLAGDLRGMYRTTTAEEFDEISRSGGAFQSGDMVTFDDAGTIADAAMVTDHQGLRHIAAREDVGGGQWALLLASEMVGAPPLGGWTWGRPVQADAVSGVDLAVDPTDGRLAVAYTTESAGTSSLYYAKFNGFTFDTTTVLSSSQDLFEDLSLAFDFSDGRPGIAYERNMSAGSDELHFAYMDASSLWQTSLVDDSISLETPQSGILRPSLAFDDYGTSWPAISYVDEDGSLIVSFDPPAPEPWTGVLLCLAVACARRRRTRSSQ
ncbi:MAG: hypothetical protein ABII12_10385, partial [Planctomycetota bacterium]